MKYFIVKEYGSENLGIMGAQGFVPPDSLGEAPLDEKGQPLPIEALDQVDATDQDGKVIVDSNGNPTKVWVKNQTKLAAHRAEKQAANEAARLEREKLSQDKKDIKNKLKQVDFSKINNLAELKPVIKDIYDFIKNLD